MGGRGNQLRRHGRAECDDNMEKLVKWPLLMRGARVRCTRRAHTHAHNRDLFIDFYSGRNAPFSNTSIIYRWDPVDIAQQIVV